MGPVFACDFACGFACGFRVSSILNFSQWEGCYKALQIMYRYGTFGHVPSHCHTCMPNYYHTCPALWDTYVRVQGTVYVTASHICYSVIYARKLWRNEKMRGRIKKMGSWKSLVYFCFIGELAESQVQISNSGNVGWN